MFRMYSLFMLLHTMNQNLVVLEFTTGITELLHVHEHVLVPEIKSIVLTETDLFTKHVFFFFLNYLQS